MRNQHGPHARVPEFLDVVGGACKRLGRRFRALKLWFLIREQGVAGLMARLRRDLENARWLEGVVRGAAYVGWNGTYQFDVDGRGLGVDTLTKASFPGYPSLYGSLDFTASGAGTFIGAGASLAWTAPSTVSGPTPTPLTLTVTESYVEGGVTHVNTTAANFVVQLHDSIKEIGDEGEDFLTLFSQSNIGTNDVLHNFSTTCDRGSGRAAEASDTPFMNVQDGFLTTHTIENIRFPEVEFMKDYVGDPNAKLRCLFDPRNPIMTGVVLVVLSSCGLVLESIVNLPTLDVTVLDTVTAPVEADTEKRKFCNFIFSYMCQVKNISP